MDKSKLKQFSFEDVCYMNGENGKRLYIVINDLVYDVTDFDHPGGRSPFADNSIDLQDEFDMVGHSRTAIAQMKNYLIGCIKKH
jgi:cytochrome b involved in lipid metabolism